MFIFITFYIPTGRLARQEIEKTGYCWSNLHHFCNIWMNVALVESSCKGEWEKLEILLKLLVILQFHAIKWFQVGRNSREWCGVPFCEVFNSQYFPALFTDKNNFFQVKMYSGLFLTVTYNLVLQIPGIFPGHLKYCYFKDISKPRDWYWWRFDFSVFPGSPRSMGTFVLTGWSRQ